MSVLNFCITQSVLQIIIGFFFYIPFVAPSSAPYSVETVTITDDSVLVSWKPPKEANGKIIVSF